VIKQNAADGGNRRFILVQLPEPLPAPESSLKTIADITRARVRSAGERLAARSESELALAPAVDAGFRAMRLTDSNLRSWNADDADGAAEVATQLDLHIQHLKPGRSADDLLFEILLKEGFPPTTRCEKVDAGGQGAYSLADGLMIVSLSRELTLEAVRAIAGRAPQRVVCLDEGFAGNDQLKANAAQIFKTKGIVFRTV
jgi:adenine-specific DNA-methyltransferase